MKLHWSPRSPFVRKVMIVLHETGLIDQVECVRSVVSMSSPPNLDVLQDNPLGKIPVLVTDEGALFDSRVICEYLNAKSKVKLIPEEYSERLDGLRLQALADGMTDILLLWRNELNHPNGHWDQVCQSYELKIKAVMMSLESNAEKISATEFNIGHVALVCALGQLDFRWKGSQWEECHPKLYQLYQNLLTRPSIQNNQIVDDGNLLSNKPHALSFIKEIH